MSVRLGLLALLEQGATYPYRLRQEFDDATGREWPLNIGQVSTTLDRLERDGLVAEVAPPGHADDDSRTQRWFDITDAGRLELAAWRESTPELDAPGRDDVEAAVLLAMIAGRDVALAVIDRQRRARLDQLQERRSLMRERRGLHSPDDPAALARDLLDEATLSRTEAALRWLDICERRLLEVDTSGTEAGRPT